MVLVFIFSPWVSWNDFEFQFKDARDGIFLEIQLFQKPEKKLFEAGKNFVKKTS